MRRMIKKLIWSGIALGIPLMSTYLWWKTYSWIYFTPAGELRGVDTVPANLLLNGIFILWVFFGMLAVGNLLDNDEEKSD